MMSLLLSIFTTLQIFASPDLDSTYSFRLNRSDSAAFSYLTKAFSGPKETNDPEYQDLHYKKYWYESSTAAITIGCTHTFAKDKEISVECSFDFTPSRSAADVDVQTLPHGVMRATVLDPEAASKIYRSLDMSPYTSNEWVRVFVADTPEEHPRVRVSCDATAIRATTARKCTIDVVLN